TKGKPENPYVMVGLISDIHKEGEYNEGTLLYRITGRAMTKALIDFSVGVIQEVATIIPSIGWLPDGEKNGLKFSGNTAAG
ncbi:NlpC/P60 family protein, partial [Paenibacillus polymyxa]|nr:NlpC/P60 family protein [Paenibacillus polymyxa]